MTAGVTLALAQLNPTVGDVAGNAAKLRAYRARAAATGADLLVTPELYLSGYSPEDLVVNPGFQAALGAMIETLARETADGGPALLLGAPWREGDKLYNAMLLLAEGKIAARTFKTDLPNYGVFDEKRVFASAPHADPMDFRGLRLGVMICEDMWTPAAASYLQKQGAAILLAPHASPFALGKQQIRRSIAGQRVRETGLPLVCLNQIGGQDDCVFDGDSFVLNAAGSCILHAVPWAEDMQLLPLDRVGTLPALPAPTEQKESQLYHAIMLGLRDYVRKNGFAKVLLGLSGGMDSALVACLAADAFGADKLGTVMMPSPYTSAASLEDAAQIASLLGCRLDTLPITSAMQAFDTILKDSFAAQAPDLTEENIQARCRGLILMALSNKFNAMVLATGNKSEMAVGYSTLYGDLCGGFAPLKDLYKTDVYALARWRNAHRPDGGLGPSGMVIPERVFTKAPTAELRPDQKDQDSLPPYDVLDRILDGLIERDHGVNDLIAEGYDAPTVQRVAAMVQRAEYKRRQAPPGPKLSTRHMGKDRRYPITNGHDVRG